MRAAKWILIAIVALVALLVAGAFVLTQVVDANRYKPEIERAVAEATGRPLKLDGDIELSFFPWIALKAGAGSLGNPAGFDGEPLLWWSEARVAAKLMPLLRDQLVIDRVTLTGAKVSLRRLADGRANWDGWGEQKASDGAPANNILNIAGVTVTEGSLNFRDDASGLTAELREWELETSAIRSGEPVDVETKFVATRDSTGSTKVATAIVARYVPSDSATTIENLDIEASVSGDSVGVAALPLKLAVPRLRIDTASSAVEETSWSASVGELAASGVVSGRWGDQSAWAGRLRLKTNNLRETLAALKVETPPTRDAAAFGPFELSTAWSYDAAGLMTSEPKTSLDATTLSGELAVGADVPRKISFALAGDQIDLTRYLEPEDVVSDPFVFPTKALKALPARGTLTFATAKLADASMKNVRIRLVLDESGVRSEAPTKQ
jgi:AsmA protein